MGYSAIWIVPTAIFMGIIIRMLFVSLEKNITRNAEYDAYVEESYDKKKILKEGPEAYEFREYDLVSNLRLDLNDLKAAVRSKRYILIVVINLLIFFKISTSTDNIFRIMVVIIVTEALLLLSLVDIAYGLIPDSVHVAIIVATVLVITTSDSAHFGSRLAGMAVGGILFWILYLLGGMGGGDVKLMAAAGFWLGYPMIIIAMFIGVLCAAVSGAILLLSGMKTRKDTMVFGPYLATGIIVTTIFCKEIINFII